MKGVVIKNTGSWYTVLTDTNEKVNCKLKGNFRLKGIRSTSPVAVGDYVEILVNADGGAFIIEIKDRRNYIIRKSPNLSKQSHIIAANIDQAFLVVTIKNPETSLTFIDRFLASAQAYQVPVTLLFNKQDLLNEDEKQLQKAIINLYETMNYRCVCISAIDENCINELKPLLKEKITLLSGNSGTGKSTIINALIPNANLKTSSISEAHNTGMHTTTFSEMLEISEGGMIIDTPGIKGFGTFDIEKEELSSYFIDIFEYSKQCRFSNCTHTKEPNCAVIKAVEEHFIAQSRYHSYLSMLEDKDENKYREAF